MGLFSPAKLFLPLLKKRRQQQKVFFPSFAILENPLWSKKLHLKFKVSTVSVMDGRTKKYNHVSIIGFVQTGIYRFSTRDISGESYIIRKWQKRVPQGPLQTNNKIFKKSVLANFSNHSLDLYLSTSLGPSRLK